MSNVVLNFYYLELYVAKKKKDNRTLIKNFVRLLVELQIVHNAEAQVQ